MALASFPGSGNTWLRYLLQQATGILTGSVYKDHALLKNGFPAESVANGSVLVVKTHEFGAKARSAFDQVILLVRDPLASLQAEFNRRSGGHTGHASVDRYNSVIVHSFQAILGSSGNCGEKCTTTQQNREGEKQSMMIVALSLSLTTRYIVCTTIYCADIKL